MDSSSLPKNVGYSFQIFTCNHIRAKLYLSPPPATIWGKSYKGSSLVVLKKKWWSFQIISCNSLQNWAKFHKIPRSWLKKKQQKKHKVTKKGQKVIYDGDFDFKKSIFARFFMSLQADFKKRKKRKNKMSDSTSYFEFPQIG